MDEFFARRVEKVFKMADRAEHDAEKLALQVFPRYLLEITRKYLRVKVEGLEKLPKNGRVIIAPNHSGCAGFDAVTLGHVIHESTGRIPRILTLWKLFEAFPAFGKIANKLGLVEASVDTGLQILKKNQMLIVFPEGEEGSFKPTKYAYRLQNFKTGFVRMAIQTRTPIVPCMIIGAEETHINLAQLRLGKYLKNTLLPLPLNLLPLPARWKIKFFDPIDLSAYSPQDVENRAKMSRLAQKIQRDLQKKIVEELRARSYVYFPAEDLIP